jgi:uncharacterized protein DUF6893
MKKRGVVMLGMMGATAAAVAIQWPEIQRYLKVRQM